MLVFQRKKKTIGKKKTAQARDAVVELEKVTGDGGGDTLPTLTDAVDEIPPGVAVSMFDCSVGNHFKAVDLISELCRDEGEFDKADIQGLKSSITFLREWKHFNYQPKSIRFTSETKSSSEKDVSNGINLPQFSAASIPKKDRENGTSIPPESSKDFIMHVGGSVWGLDWCPRVHQCSEHNITCEFIAVAVHPPDSSYHKMGAPLTGRGLVQIWCLVTAGAQEGETGVNKKPKRKPRQPNSTNKPLGRPRKYPVTEKKPKRPRGRPKKLPDLESVEPLAIDSSEETGKKRKLNDEPGQPERSRGRPKKNSIQISESLDGVDSFNAQLIEDSPSLLSIEPDRPKNPIRRARKKVVEVIAELSEDSSTGNPKSTSKKRRSNDSDYEEEFVEPLAFEAPETENDKEKEENDEENNEENEKSEIIFDGGKKCSSISSKSIPMEVAFPRAMMCLAHNGKVAWDVKWQPCNSEFKHRMGVLAVLLGNGALEVWEVPSPRALKRIYSGCEKEGTDPRFIKLEPVFKCSKLLFGDRRSIPLTVEWSTSSPHDLILAGCHDGVVAVWKFTANHSCKDTKPLLCFSADTVPIRTLAWAPLPNDSESSNVFVTAGHKGLKFWDMRDPSRPLWDLNPTQRIIYSLDWVADPSCMIIAYDDGTLRILGMLKAANDVAVTGKPFSGTTQQGLHSYFCSSFPIWNVGISRSTGLVAYCSADGTTLRFQLTTKAVEKDPLRNRASHFLCGSLTEDNSGISVYTALPNIPFPMKKSTNEWGNAPRSIRGFVAVSNQEKRAKQEHAKIHNHTLVVRDGGDDDDVIAEGTEKNEAAKSRVNGVKNGDGEEEKEAFPSKMVAMHRLRWNMNKGCERWLCFGGAAGILRCQYVEDSDVY